MTYLIWFVGIYLALGIAFTVALSRTPYGDNAWWLTTLLWPLCLISIIAS